MKQKTYSSVTARKSRPQAGEKDNVSFGGDNKTMIFRDCGHIEEYLKKVN